MRANTGLIGRLSESISHKIFHKNFIYDFLCNLQEIERFTLIVFPTLPKSLRWKRRFSVSNSNRIERRTGYVIWS